MGCTRPKKIGWLRHVLTALSATLLVCGVAVLVFQVWVLTTSAAGERLLSGRLVFTYSTVGVGLLLLLTGLMGWLAGASERPCLLRTHVVLVGVALMTEAAAIVALSIMGSTMEDILVNGWAEVNQGTRNIIQGSMDCCGFYGPREFAYTSIPIDDSCYEQRAVKEGPLTLKQAGCGALLQRWFSSHRPVWCGFMAGLAGLQLLGAGLGIHILRKLRDKSRMQKQRHPYGL